MTDKNEKHDNIKNESTISRQLQQRVPHPELKTYEKSDVSQFDTADEEISRSLIKEIAVTNTLKWDNGSVIASPDSIDIIELKPTSQLTQYNKCHIKEDREGHLFYFDFSEGNIRTHLRHPKGTYWTIDHEGSYNSKIVKDQITIIKSNQRTVVGENCVRFVKNDDKVSVKGDHVHTTIGQKSVSVGGDLLTRIKGNRFDQTDTDHHYIGGGDTYYKLKGGWFNEVQGAFTLYAKENIHLQTPNVMTLDCGKLVLRTNSSYSEQVEGKKSIECDLLSLTGGDKIAMSTTGPLQIMAGGVEEVITGVTIPPSTDAKTTKIGVGNYLLETTLGNITFESLTMGISLICTLKNAEINIGLTGVIEMTNTFGSATITATGDIELENMLGSVKILKSKLEIDHMAKIFVGTMSAEKAVMGKKLITWLKSHNHGTGVGPSSPPIQSGTCNEMMLCSQRVKIGL